MKVGFIGLGHMGGPMAANVLKAGFSLTVNDIRRESADDLLRNGAIWADTPAEIARASDVILTSLPGPPEVELVALGESGLIHGVVPNSVFIDLSTSSPSLIRRIEPVFKEKGSHVLDGPVSGGVTGAASGKLAVMIGGDKAIFERCKPVLDAIGDKITYCGGLGAGSVCKLMHNCIGDCIRMAVAECFTVAVKAGVEPDIVWKTVRDGAVGRGIFLDEEVPQKWFTGNFEPDFPLILGLKDVSLAADLGREVRVPMMTANLAVQQIVQALGRGWDEKDFHIVTKLQEERAGVDLRVDHEVTLD